MFDMLTWRALDDGHLNSSCVLNRRDGVDADDRGLRYLECGRQTIYAILLYGPQWAYKIPIG